MSRLYFCGPECDLDERAFRPSPTGSLRLYSRGGGGGSTTTVQKADPWLGVQPDLHYLYDRAEDWMQSGSPAFFPSTTIVPQSDVTLKAADRAALRAWQGSPLLRGGQDVGYRTLRGDYLGSNPFLNAMYRSASDPLVDQFSRAVAPAITSQFALGGRYGSGAHQGAITDAAGKLGQSLAAMGASIYGPAYESERGRQQQMIGVAPQLAAADYDDMAKLAQIGAMQEARAQEELNEQIARWDFGQNQELAKLQAYNQLLQGGASFGQTSSQTRAPGQSGFNLGGALGGAMMGAQALPALGAMGALGSTAAASTMMGGAGLGALGGMALGPAGLLAGALLGGLF